VTGVQTWLFRSYDVDDEILPKGSALLAALAWDFLVKKAES
jgi:hypothetical protein